MQSVPMVDGARIAFANIHGLRYQSGVLTPSEEIDLIAIIDQRPWLEDLSRRVQHYGYRYDYRAHRISTDSYLGPLPEWLHVLAERITGAGLMAHLPDQAIVNEYLPGQGISAHVDCVPCFGPQIVTVSLGSTCLMQFRERNGNRHRELMLHPRSVLVLTEEARYEWSHAIPARKTDAIDGLVFMRSRRLSVTFRTVREHSSIAEASL